MKRNWERIVEAVATALGLIFLLGASIGSLFVLMSLDFTSAIPELAGIVAALLGIVAAAFTAWKGREIRFKAGEIELLEGAPSKPESDAEFLHRQVDRAIAREDLTRLRSERRSGSLFLMGVLFLWLSILCPIAAAAMYWQMDPFPATSLAQLKELKGVVEAPKSVSDFGRDWHILVGGIAFGFLFLAAASGLLRERAKEVATLARSSANVGYYERLKIILDLKLRQFSTEQTVLAAYLVDQLEDVPNFASDQEKPPTEDGESSGKLIADFVKSLRGST